MPTTHLPTSLRAASFCFIAQTPLGKVAKGVAGDVMFSGYLCIPLPDKTTWLRRVLAVELNLPCVPRSLELAALRSTVRSDHNWMDEMPPPHKCALQAVVEGDDAYC